MGPEWLIPISLFLAVPIICGIVTKNLAAGKGRDASGEKVGWFLLGFFFPVIGIIVALIIGPKAAASDRPPMPPPPG
jgi:hypothetical protein